MDIRELEKKRILVIEQAETELKQMITNIVMNNRPKSATRSDYSRLRSWLRNELEKLETDDKFIEQALEALNYTYMKWYNTYMGQLINVAKQVNLNVLNATIANMQGKNPNKAVVKQSGGFTIADGIAGKGTITNLRDFVTHAPDGGAARYVDYVKLVKDAMQDISKQIADGTLTLKDKRGHSKSIRGMAEIQARYNIINDDLKRLGERGVKYVIASTHPNASERCSWWQGKIFKVDFDVASRKMTEYKGKPEQTIIGYIDGRKVYSLKQACENGFLSYNCQHRLIAYYKGVNPKQYTMVEVKERRELSQKQRYLERRIRQAKAREVTAITPADKKQARLQSQELQEQYKTFCDKNNLIRYDWRTRITETERGLTGLGNVQAIENGKERISVEPIEINVVESSFSAIPKKIKDIQVNRVKSILKNNPDIANLFKDNPLSINAASLAKGTIAECSVEPYLDDKDITITLNDSEYKDIDKLIRDEKYSVLDGFTMPCSEEHYKDYSITHEFGHAVSYVLMKQEVANNMSKYIEQRENYQGFRKPSLAYFYSRDFGHIMLKFVREITKIAKAKNPKFEKKRVLSEYGQSNSYEAFAEMFANAKCGKPNELGNAMNEWLEKRLKQ